MSLEIKNPALAALLLLPLAACMPPPPNSRAPYINRQNQPAYLWASPRSGLLNNPRGKLTIGGQPIEYRRDMLFYYPQIYAAREDYGRLLPQIPYARVNPQYLRQIVNNNTGENTPGTIIIDRKRHYLYLVLEGGLALRYGVGIGREGFSWSGTAQINRKAVWPQWNATQGMIDRARSDSEPLRRHMDGQLDNPMAARALYIAENTKGGLRDTLYRIHGTPEWWTIGKDVTSGCFRMFNQDIADLYERVPAGAKIVVR